MAVDLAGKGAVVTGASKGIGRAIARDLARAGAGVVISARNEDEVRRAREELSAETGGRVVGVRCDVREHAQVREMIAGAARDLGGIDVLVNNAGVGGFGPVDEMDPAEWDQIIDTNLSGVFYCCHEAVPELKRRGGGWIINIASLAGKNPFAGGAAYNASKFGLVGFSEALMLDVRKHGIRVNYIMPGSVATYFNGHVPSPDDAWKIQPGDIARLVMDLLAFPSNALPSRIEIRPSQPPAK
ncbi:MAG: short-chain dehydrogenase/reductase [Gemmatimonadetes bacterium]|nr:short-chain dehydrogenase/reductase [Gemmatimonadota bacterium]